MKGNVRMMRALAVLLGCLVAGGALAQQTSSQSERVQERSKRQLRTDQLFVRETASGGQMEVELGNVAQQKAANPQVKEFGQRMVEDHTKANQQLQALAQQKGIELPGTMRPEHQNTVRRLSALSGAEFDRAYMQVMVRDHRKDVTAFERQARRGRDPEFKQFARDTVPTLREHLKHAQQIQAQLKTGTGANGETTGTTTTTGAAR